MPLIEGVWEIFTKLVVLKELFGGRGFKRVFVHIGRPNHSKFVRTILFYFLLALFLLCTMFYDRRFARNLLSLFYINFKSTTFPLPLGVFSTLQLISEHLQMVLKRKT